MRFLDIFSAPNIAKQDGKRAMLAKPLRQRLESSVLMHTHDRARGIVSWVARIVSVSIDIQIQKVGSGGA